MSATPMTVLVADDEPAVRGVMKMVLERGGYAVVEADNGADALQIASSGHVEAVLLDLQLPQLGGIDVLRDLRRSSSVPVIVVSGITEVEERVLALELGADDYLTKPFIARELLARVRALLRRTQPARPQMREVVDEGPLHIDVPARQVTLRGEPIEFTTKEFDLLTFLAASPRRVFSREDLLREVWGSRIDWQDPATVTEHIRRIRLKVEADATKPRLITTVRSVGYRFEAPVAVGA